MGWIPRICGENLYHHIYAWGNDRHPVFKSVEHYQKYLIMLEEYALCFDVDILAYALMESHVHLFIYDRSKNISVFMMNLHGHYARYYNKINERVGHVFGERFNNKLVLANVYGKWLSRYIHRQATEAGIVEDPADYPWSSYRTYMGLEMKEFVKSNVILEQFGEGESRLREYRAFVLSHDDGPVDWSRRYFTLLEGSELIDYAGRIMNVDRSVLLEPQGIKERHLRHYAIRLLYERYGFKPALLARAFRLSRVAVTGILMRRKI
ncbi:MAG: transposase [candidate division WOR-3 bacterium]|nr:transposase [candidate division WOR-3 bacterium]